MMKREPRVVWVEPSYWTEEGGWYVYEGESFVAGPFVTKLGAEMEARTTALVVS